MTDADLVLRLLPIAIVAAITPLKASALILLMRSPQSSRTGMAFVVGIAGAMLAQGFALVAIFAIFGIFATLEREAQETVSFGLLVVVGLLLLVGAVRLRVHEQDEDQPPPSWMEGIETFSPRRALSLGFGWAFLSPKQWVFTLAAISIIFFAGLGQTAAIANYAVFIIVSTSTLWVLLLVHALFGERIKPTLDRLLAWLESNTLAIIFWLLLIFGAFFLVVGLLGLTP